METIKRIRKGIISWILFFAAMLTIFDFFIKYRSDMKSVIVLIKQLDFSLIGQVLQIIGFAIVLVVPLILIINILILRKPKRDLADLVVPFLLQKDQLIDSKRGFDKKVKEYFIIKIGLILIICGLSIVIGMKVYNYFGIR